MYHLVILPGWGGSHTTWQEFVAKANAVFSKVTVVDLPCFGDEPCPPTVWGVEEYAQFAFERLRHFGSDFPLVLLGHSFGGQVATYLVSQYPVRFAALILVGAAVVRPRHAIRRFFFGFGARLARIMFLFFPFQKQKERLKKFFYARFLHSDYATTTGISRDIYQNVIRQDMRAFLPSIAMPTLVVWGKKDKVTPVRHGKKMARLLPNATWVCIPNGRHGLHHHPTQAVLLRAIEEFLRL
ncbi:MAG TPA: hypothetical protein DCY48_01955 [Candidatus Magasanikbacteria bacterium]|nr:MAG: hypothetical protein A3I74_00865 [Candidatus Magasanikbacteria bacterium RIFCSPLOWO2_02_FULL_47_16]OGH80003.1 MAG: hypothetical protein A3C10_02360 [Candidatus Magasanikbacteria bacterium RIFCSPHIGHO2_02_FULL_48_18]HAZ28520.1 hypothetical protein [Candidatus Magasanikbacteria bacterium]